MKKILYLLSDLPKIGPTNQTLSIIKSSMKHYDVFVLTLFDETDKFSVIDNYRNNNIIVDCLHLNGFVNAIFNGVTKVMKYVKEKNIDIIHSYGTIADFVSEKVSKKSGCKHIISLRVFPKEDLYTRMSFFKATAAYYIHLKALKSCDNVCACSFSLKEKMINKYKFANKLYVIQNGVDLEKYNFNNSTNFESNFICLSSVISRKRIDESIEGFLKSKFSTDSKLYIVGDGELLSYLKEKYSYNNSIVFVGKTSNVQEYLLKSSYFISSSESEGLPNSLLESLAFGLIPIISNIPQHLEVINQINPISEIYELGNIEDLVRKINSVPNNFDREYNRNLLINSPFNASIMGNKYVELYKKILVGDSNELC